MAEAGEGKAEFIFSGESMEEKVLRQLKRALKPALTDIKVNWGSVNKVEQTPFRLPPLFSGGRLVIYGFVPKETKGMFFLFCHSYYNIYSHTHTKFVLIHLELCFSDKL
jgi:hypothetical protein